jgi:hypothetical protein
VLQSFGNSVVSLATADFQTEIGGNFAHGANGGEGSLGHVVSHGVVGCISEVFQGGNCAAGAAGGAAAALYAGHMKGVNGDKPLSEEDREQQICTAGLISGLSGSLFSEGDFTNASLAGSVGASAYRNNFLTHQEWEQQNTAREQCKAGSDAACEIAALLQERDVEREHQLAHCVGDYSTDCLVLRATLREAAASFAEASARGQIPGVESFDATSFVANYGLNATDVALYADDKDLGLWQWSRLAGDAYVSDSARIFMSGSRSEIQELVKAPVVNNVLIMGGELDGGGSAGRVRLSTGSRRPVVAERWSGGGHGEREASVTATNRGTRPDFYVSPNGEAVEGTLYRYSDSAYADDILQNGGSPGIDGRGHYLGTEALDTASSVRDRYQIAPEWSNPTVRGELDSIQLYDPNTGAWRLQTPTSNGNTTTFPEPYTSAYPEYGAGGARQYITNPNTPLRYDNVDIIGD